MDSKQRWYRKWDLDISKEQVIEVCKDWTRPARFQDYNVTRLAGPHTPEDCPDLRGKRLVFRGGEAKLVFDFGEGSAIRFTDGDKAPVDCVGNTKTMDHQVYFVNHLVPGYPCARQITLVADLKTGCATVVDAHFGTENSNIDVGREFIFGKLDDYYTGAPLHDFTQELLGQAISWEYREDFMRIKHIYNSNLYYTYCAAAPNGAWMATNPADYVKVRDGLYIFSFVEERQHGLQAVFLIDTEHYHDIGSFFCFSDDHILSACVGARGEKADMTTVF